jgi:hypothetical protein
MKLAGRIKPVSFFKANALKAVRDVFETRTPLILTLGGEGVAVVQDIYSFDEAQRTLDEAAARLSRKRNRRD